MRTVARFAAALLTLSGAAAAFGGAAAAAPGCVRILQAYDRAERAFSYDGAYRDVAVPTAMARQAQRARQADCITRDTDLGRTFAGPEAFAGVLQGAAGAPIRPTWLQVGVVAGIASEVQARSFFGELGFIVRSRGAPGLGRRIFIGPFATTGGLAEATDLALQAGFVAPYARRF